MVEKHDPKVHIEETNRRVDRLERDLSTLTDKVISLSDLTVQTNTNVENLITQVSNLFGRTQPKPTNWTVVIAGLSLAALIGTLTLTPLYKKNAEQKLFDVSIVQHLESNAREMGMVECNLEWLKTRDYN